VASLVDFGLNSQGGGRIDANVKAHREGALHIMEGLLDERETS
jgi:hypothetical protein